MASFWSDTRSSNSNLILNLEMSIPDESYHDIENQCLQISNLWNWASQACQPTLQIDQFSMSIRYPLIASGVDSILFASLWSTGITHVYVLVWYAITSNLNLTWHHTLRKIESLMQPTRTLLWGHFRSWRFADTAIRYRGNFHLGLTIPTSEMAPKKDASRLHQTLNFAQSGVKSFDWLLTVVCFSSVSFSLTSATFLD